MACGNDCDSCPTCLGHVAQDGPAMQDLNFAVRTETTRPQHPYWAAMSVVQRVRHGAARRGVSEDDAALIQHLEHVTNRPGANWSPTVGGLSPSVRASIARERDPFTPLWLRAIYDALKRIQTNDRISGHSLNLKNLAPTYYVRTGSGGGGPGGKPPPEKYLRRCCVKEFLFPESIKKTYTPDGETVKVGIDFNVHAEYTEESGSAEASGDADSAGSGSGSDGGAGGWQIETCDCTCCEFEQYVKRFDGKGYNRECFLVDVAPDRRSFANPTSQWPDNDFPPQPGDSTRFISCPGVGQLVKPFPGSEEITGTYSGACMWDWTDHTGIKGKGRTLIGKRFHAGFIGKIVDACRSRSVVRIEHFILDFTIGGFSGVGSPWEEPGAVTGPGFVPGSPGNATFHPPRVIK